MKKLKTIKEEFQQPEKASDKDFAAFENNLITKPIRCSICLHKINKGERFCYSGGGWILCKQCKKFYHGDDE